MLNFIQKVLGNQKEWKVMNGTNKFKTQLPTKDTGNRSAW